jgi:glyoxylase I family protein
MPGGGTIFPGIAHAALTVSDLSRSVPWYAALFGAEPDKLHAGETFSAAVWLLPGGTVVLHGFRSQPSPEPFDERRPGLDHLAFGCADRGELEAWIDRLNALGIKHSDIVDEAYGSGLSFRDPDNIALEFFVPPR